MSSLLEPAAVQAREPFHFSSSTHLLRIAKERAINLGEFLDALKQCPEGAIFEHTFRTLEEHHFIRRGYSNDFAHWTSHDCGETGLGEKLAAIDVREFTSIVDLRRRIIETVEGHLQQNPAVVHRPARKAFYFCSPEAVVLPTAYVAHNLTEFIEALRQVTIHSIYHHFIEARLRLQLETNDFSLWLKDELGLAALAERVNQIDIYTSTLEGVRHKIEHILTAALSQVAQPSPLSRGLHG